MTATLLAEGKTKRILATDDPRNVVVVSKDAITADDGARRDQIVGKAELATVTTCNVFRYLAAEGVPTHYLSRVDTSPTQFLARRVQMIPLEVVMRRIATGSYLKRHPEVAQGTAFDQLVIEFFDKDDAGHDPLVIFDFWGRRLLRYHADQPASTGFWGEQSLAASRFAAITPAMFSEMGRLGRSVFQHLERAWSRVSTPADQLVTLVDLKIEFGIIPGTSQILVADVIDNDSWRIWPGGDSTNQLDKQVYRDLADVPDSAAKAKALGRIKDNYAWVSEATAQFSSRLIHR